MRSTGISPHLAVGDQVAVQGLPAFQVRLAIFVEGRLLAILELGPLLDQQLDEIGVLRHERQEGAHGHGDALQRVLDVGNGGVDGLAHLPHDAVDGGEEKLFLAGEIAVDRALADLQLVGQHLRIGLCETVAGEELDGGIDDFFAAAVGRRVGSAGRPGLRREAFFITGPYFVD